MKRFVTFLVLAVTLGTAGCKDPATQGADASSQSSFVRAGKDIVIQSVRTFAPSDSVAGHANEEYYIVKFTFTNNLGYSLVPHIENFVLQGITDQIRYLGADTGNAALVGISNYPAQLKVGDSHDYTVGFRVPESTYGTLFYDASF